MNVTKMQINNRYIEMDLLNDLIFCRKTDKTYFCLKLSIFFFLNDRIKDLQRWARSFA